MLGPVLERLQDELLDPLIENTFDVMEAGIAPPAPDELQGPPAERGFRRDVGARRSGRSAPTASIDSSATSAVAQFKPEVLDRFDSDRWAEVYSDSLSLDPQIIVRAIRPRPSASSAPKRKPRPSRPPLPSNRRAPLEARQRKDRSTQCAD